MLYERTAISKKPAKTIQNDLNLLKNEHQITPDLVFKDPYFLNFLGLKDTYSEKYLEESMSDDFISIYQEALKKSKNNVSKPIVIEYIMKNIETMQKNGFLKDAPSRTVMPQTDGTKDLKANQDLWKSPLTKGEINVLPNFKTESKKWIKTYEQFRRK
jgi:hypothetical protein